MASYLNFQGVSGIRVDFNETRQDRVRMLNYNIALTGNQFNVPNPIYLSAGDDISSLANDSNFITRDDATSLFLDKDALKHPVVNSITFKDTNCSILQKAFFVYNIGTTLSNVAVFERRNLKLIKYLITVFDGGSSSSCEVLVSHNGASTSGTVYGLVDAQSSGEIDGIGVSLSPHEVFLQISSYNEGRTAIIRGEAIYYSG